MTGWTVTFILPAGRTLTGSWNGAVTVSGRTVTVRNAAHNGALAPGPPPRSASRPPGRTATPPIPPATPAPDPRLPCHRECQGFSR
ncbi:cellulose binding domain-containing protein [Nonomuraea bangladeshensis]|uniref:cellulose binding domain-containing protein n=1 Tax=Nonomuraea bangladeshensis TaxID=404385 RepID=UPI0031D7E3E6